MDTSAIAAQVRAWRVRRGMTQQQLADALGRHLTWVKKFEAGDRQADPRVSVLTGIARALDVPLAALLEPSPRHAETADTESAVISDLKAALLRPARVAAPRTAADLGREVAYGYDAYQSSDYRALGRLLPGLIEQARALSADAGSTVAGRVLADTCHLAAITLMKLGDAPAAWHAADKALAAAGTSGDPVTAVLCAQALAWAAAAIGQGPAGIAVAQHALDTHGPALAARGEDGWTAIGMIQLKAAVAAAAAGEPSLTRDMISAARESAGHVRPDANVRKTGFNATNVALYEASVLARLGDHTAALDAAGRIHPAALAALPRERRTHHLVETAASALAAGHADTALGMLCHAERISPQEVHALPAARSVITGLVCARRPPSRKGELRELARRAGVTG